MHSMLYRLSNINGNIFIHISVITKYSIIIIIIIIIIITTTKIELKVYKTSQVLKLCKNVVSKHLVIEGFLSTLQYCGDL